MTGPSRLKRILLKIVLALFSVALCVGLVEGLLRLYGYHYTPLSIQLEEKTKKEYSEWRDHHAFQDKHFTYDPYLIWVPRKDTPGFNAQGYRGKELSVEKKPGSYRVFAIGDSNTLGWVGDDSPNWPRYLEGLLTKKDDRFTVVNAGVYGYTSFQGLRVFKQALRYEPDMVLISFGCNDGMRVTVPDAKFLNRTRWDTTLCKAKVGQLLLECADKLFTKGKGELVPRVDVPEYRSNLEEIIRIAKDKKIKVVLLTRPFTGPSQNELWWKNFAPQYNAATREVGKGNNVPIIDICSEFEEKDQYFSDEAHFTKEGHERAAHIIYDGIRPLLPDPG
jgi:lysophospholipase L1-like esterase